MKTKFGKFAILGASALTIAALVAGSTPAFADAIPYPNVGTPITTSTSITATGSMSSILIDVGFSAADTDVLDIFNLTQHIQSGYIFLNQTSTGQVVDLATNPGDMLVIEVLDETGSEAGAFYSTLAAPTGLFTCVAPVGMPTACTGVSTTAAPDAEPGVSHAYVTPVTTSTLFGIGIPSGVNPTFVGVEDRDKAEGSDYDYNDDQFVLTGVTTSSVPEPGSIALLGTGILAGAGMIRRRLAKA